MMALVFLLIGQLCAAQAQFHWSSVAIGGGGFVSAIVSSPVDKNLFYARTDVGGAYRWDEKNKKWFSMMDWVDASERGLLGVEAIAVDPKLPGKVYMMTGTSYWNEGRSAFLRSKDRGNTWDVIYTWDKEGAKGNAITKFGVHGNGMGRGNGEAISIDPNNSNIIFYGSKNKGMFKSIDNGTTWNHVDAFTSAAGSDTTWNGSGFSFVQFSSGSSQVIYAGFLRESNNVFHSLDAGASWTAIPIPAGMMTTNGGSRVRLMPQRAVTSSDGSKLTVTFGDGAGPHTMTWNEGWGMIYDGFGRGAVFQYDVATKTWTDISPEDFIDQTGDSKSAKFDNVDVKGLYESGCSGDDCEKYYPYAPAFGGVSINPGNSNEMLVTHLGYWGCQYWSASTEKWSGSWASNIYRTTDGGATWVPFFSNSFDPRAQLTDGGIGWINGNSLHWAGSIAFDPFNTDRVWATSGNGVFKTENLTAYSYDAATFPFMINSGTTQQWSFTAHGIEETVPEDVISIPGGPLVSVLADYDGFRHDDVAKHPANRHKTNVAGSDISLGSTRALAFAPKSGTLVKVSDTRKAEMQYNTVAISPLQYSSDRGKTWKVATYEKGVSEEFIKGYSVAISTDGEATLWTPGVKIVNGDEAAGNYPVQRYTNSAWTPVTGIDGAYVVGDPEDANIFYAYSKKEGTLYKSTDKGITFTKAGTPGISNFKKFRLAPNRSGDLWVPLTGLGLTRSTDGGTTFAKIPNVTYCEAVGFGKAAPGKTYPAVYMYGTVNTVTGVFQSIDEGATWMRINDDHHEYGGLANGEFVVGDMNTFGVVYMSTAGRGIACRLPGPPMATYQPDKKGTLSNPLPLIRLSANFLVISPTEAEPLTIQVYSLHGKLIGIQRVNTAVSLPLASLVNTTGSFIIKVRNQKRVVFVDKFAVID